MEKEIALQNQEKYKPLVESELWPLIKSYTDAMCTKSNKVHEKKIVLKDSKESMKKELLKIIDKYCEEGDYGI
jgi:hypothetical protein